MTEEKCGNQNAREQRPPRRGGHSRRGRPRQIPLAEREQLILDAVERVIAARGLSGVSMAAIAREAGMSKRTVYSIWNSRDSLFEALVRRLRASVLRPLASADRDLPLVERLRRLLRPEVRHVVADARLAVLRAVVAEAPRHPQLAETFVREGPGSARRIVREELDRAIERGEIALSDTYAAAAILLDMAYANPLDRLINPDEPAPSSAAAEARLDLALRIFLHGAALGQAG